jgi:predicted porin
MKKTLIAATIAATFAAPMIASAQAGSVVLYGSMRAGFSLNKTGSASAHESGNYSSRFGIRASDDLGGGMRGFMQLEIGYDASALGTNANFGTRESWVGLGGGFGELKFGSGLNAYYDVASMNNNSIVSGFNNIGQIYFGTLGTGFAAYNTCVGTAFIGRYANSVRYTSPRLGPVSYRAHYAIGNETATGRKCSAFDNAIVGGFGPVQFGVAYALHNNFLAGANLVEHDAKNVIGTIKGKIGIVDANLGFESARYSANWNTSSAKYNALVAGLGVNFGPTKVGVDHTRRNNGIRTSATSGIHNTRLIQDAAGGGHLTTLYVNHGFSKRTTGYVWHSRDNPETGVNRSQTSLVLRHDF